MSYISGQSKSSCPKKSLFPSVHLPVTFALPNICDVIFFFGGGSFPLVYVNMYVKYALISVLVIWDGVCINDEPRVYSHNIDIGDSNAVETCQDYCFDEGFTFMGVEGKTWCRCGHTPPPLANRLAAGECDWECPGNSKETCGGAHKMNVYQIEKGDFSQILFKASDIR